MLAPVRYVTAVTEEQMLTLQEAAQSLGVSPATLRSQIRYGSITGRKVGPVWVLDPEEVERYRTVSLGRKGPKGK